MSSAAGPPAALPTTTHKSTVALQEVQETVSRIAAHKGVTAVLILNSAGDIVTQSGKDVVGNVKLLSKMLDAASKYVQSIPNENEDEEEEISFVRIRTKHEEILVAPKCNYVLVVLQDPSISTL
jgi:dynein light chain roadblock-type